MSSAIIFAIISLVFAGLNDVVFKRYSAVERSRGMVICGIGVVWSVLLIIDVKLGNGEFVFSQPVWTYGFAAGISVAVANIMLLVSLRFMEVSLGSTIYRLNTIAVVILSAIFLGESLSSIKLAGVVCGVIAVLLLYQHQNSAAFQTDLRTGLIIVILAALLRALYGVITKAGLTHGADGDSLMLFSSLCWVVSGLLYAILVEHRYTITAKKLAYSLLSGVLVYAIVKSLLIALSLGDASIVVTIANLSFLMALLVALVLKMEVLSGRKFMAMGFAISAIAILAQA